MNRTNTTVGYFFSLKKSNPLELRLPLRLPFIEKCWNDNKGLRRQSNNWLEVGINERRTSPIVRKRTVDRMKRYVLDVDENENIDHDVASDHDVCRIEEGLNRSFETGEKRKKGNTGYYQKGPDTPLTFSLTRPEKDGKKLGSSPNLPSTTRTDADKKTPAREGDNPMQYDTPRTNAKSVEQY